MTTQPESRCPRCGAGFHCGIEDAAPCRCTAIHIDAALQQRLRERYTGCLCLRCLDDLSRGAAIEFSGSEAAAITPPAQAVNR